jgi:hypothetical protein
MPDYEPSDPNGARPINRLAIIWDRPPELSHRELLLRALREAASAAADGDEEDLDRDEEDAICQALDVRATYRAVYSLVRAEMASGLQPEQIRAGLKEIAAGDEKTLAAFDEAVEDALAGRPSSR